MDNFVLVGKASQVFRTIELASKVEQDKLLHQDLQERLQLEHIEDKKERKNYYGR